MSSKDLSNPRLLCVIPARGGSKRIPKKNVKEFNGKPLIGYSIETALKTALFDRIVVSTDDAEISSVAKKFGASVPFERSVELSDDFVRVEEVLWHALDFLSQNGETFDFLCMMYATAPSLRAEDVVKGFEVLKSEPGAYGSVSVCSYDSSIWRSLKKTESGSLEYNWPENFRSRSQDLPESYFDCGMFFWLDAAKFYEAKVYYHPEKGFPGPMLPVKIERQFVQDLDTLEDWDVSEIKYEILKRKGLLEK